MSFLEPDITVIIPLLDKLSPDMRPKWGSMSVQRMVEHLTESIRLASGKESFPLEITEDRIERMQAFLNSDKPMAQNIEVSFAGKDVPLKNEELELAIDEFLLEWIDFEQVFEENPSLKISHPYYGPLDYDQWLRLHAKHLTHHLTQFGLIS